MNISDSACTELTGLLHTLSDILGTQTGNDDLEREADRHLQAVRDSFKRIVKYGKDDVFVRHLMQQLGTLAAVFVDAFGKGRLPVTGHEFESAQLLASAFNSGNRVFRYTWKIEAGQRLFEDAAWRRHFELTSTMAMSGSLEIRTIMIGENRSVFEAANVQKLLEFFAGQEKMVAKIVLTTDWDVCMVDHAIPSSCIEFGIYGANLLYQADAYQPVSAGSWSRDAIDMGRFTHFFDAVWNMPTVAANNPAASAGKMSLSRLMNADVAHDRRNAVHQTVARIEEHMKADAV